MEELSYDFTAFEDFIGKFGDYDRKKLIKEYGGNAEFETLLELMLILLQSNMLSMKRLKDVFYLAFVNYLEHNEYLRSERLRLVFLKRMVQIYWCDFDWGALKKESAVYVLVEHKKTYGNLTECEMDDCDIVYVGCTTNLAQRYKCHKIPSKIRSNGKMCKLYYLPMEKGFFDYELKLIKKLKPKYNKLHKGVF